MLRKWYAYICAAVVCGIAASSAMAFQQQPVPSGGIPGLSPDAAQLVDGDIKSQLITPEAEAQGSKNNNKSSGWLSALPKLNFGLEFLYGDDSQVVEEFTPDDLKDDAGADFTIMGTVKKKF